MRDDGFETGDRVEATGENNSFGGAPLASGLGTVQADSDGFELRISWDWLVLSNASRYTPSYVCEYSINIRPSQGRFRIAGKPNDWDDCLELV